jgi:multiple sugar transport system substrate-binding protein
MSRKALGLMLVVALAIMFVGALPSNAQEKVTVTWFIGLGTGGQPAQIDAQNAAVDAYNASQDKINLQIVIAENSVAPDTLSTLIASGEAPDIVGPVGGDGANRFYGSWLDLQPLVDSTGYDLTQFPQSLVDHFRTDEGLVSLPFATYPSFIYYLPAAFDEAGLEYPPDAYDKPYVLDGEEVTWDVDVLREVAMRLTVDADGNDATMDAFDPENIVQWGFDFQWPNPRQIPTLWGAGNVYDPETGQAVIPDYWRVAFNWYYNGMWVDHFYPNAAQIGSDQLAAGNPFESGNMAMVVSHSWYTCCLSRTDWQTAADPSYNGKVTARLHADTFRILNTTKHPEEAFDVLTYLVGKSPEDTGASDALFLVYGAMPARESQMDSFFSAMDEKYPQGVNWDVVKASVAYAEVPSHEAWFPNYSKAEDVLQNFQTKLDSTPGLNVDDELDQLQKDLQAVFDEVKTTG